MPKTKAQYAKEMRDQLGVVEFSSFSKQDQNLYNKYEKIYGKESVDSAEIIIKDKYKQSKEKYRLEVAKADKKYEESIKEVDQNWDNINKEDAERLVPDFKKRNELKENVDDTQSRIDILQTNLIENEDKMERLSKQWEEQLLNFGKELNEEQFNFVSQYDLSSLYDTIQEESEKEGCYFEGTPTYESLPEDSMAIKLLSEYKNLAYRQISLGKRIDKENKEFEKATNDEYEFNKAKISSVDVNGDPDINVGNINLDNERLKNPLSFNKEDLEKYKDIDTYKIENKEEKEKIENDILYNIAQNEKYRESDKEDKRYEKNSAIEAAKNDAEYSKDEYEEEQKYVDMRRAMNPHRVNLSQANINDAFDKYAKAQSKFDKLNGWQQFWAKRLPASWYGKAELYDELQGYKEAMKDVGYDDKEIETKVNEHKAALANVSIEKEVKKNEPVKKEQAAQKEKKAEYVNDADVLAEIEQLGKLTNTMEVPGNQQKTQRFEVSLENKKNKEISAIKNDK